MLQTLLAGLIVAAAALWLTSLLVRRLRPGGPCDCSTCGRREVCERKSCPTKE